MKKLIIFCATLALLAAFSAQADLIIDTDDGKNGDATTLKDKNNYPKDNDPASVYVSWIRENFELSKKAWMMRFAKFAHPRKVKCLDYIGGYYDFSNSGDSYTFSCFAVPIKKSNSWITHKLTYTIDFKYVPYDCTGSAADLEAYFAEPRNRTQRALKQKMAFINQSCALSIPTIPSNKITMEKFDPSDLGSLLDNEQERNVEVYLENDGRKKSSRSSDDEDSNNGDCANVLRCNRDNDSDSAE